MAGYEALYLRTTGESFLGFYGSTRLGQSISLTEARVLPHALANMVWYAIRLVWFAAPWSLFALASVAVWIHAKTRGQRDQPFEVVSDRGLLWAVLTTAVFILALSPALVRAERFIFPTYFIVGGVGVVTAMRTLAGVRRFAATADQYRWLPVATWTVTFLLSLGSRALR
jgi:hypothetical protein